MLLYEFCARLQICKTDLPFSRNTYLFRPYSRVGKELLSTHRRLCEAKFRQRRPLRKLRGGLVALAAGSSATAINAPETLRSKVPAAAVPRSNPQDSTVGSLPKGRPANPQGLPPSPVMGGLVAPAKRGKGATAIRQRLRQHRTGYSACPVPRRFVDCTIPHSTLAHQGSSGIMFPAVLVSIVSTGTWMPSHQVMMTFLQSASASRRSRFVCDTL